MPTYLMTWNPEKWAWDNSPEAAELTATGQVFESRWSSGNTKAISPGDRVFLLRQGVEPRGIVGAGWTSSETYEAPHWDGNGGKTLFVDVAFERVLNPATEQPLRTDQFTTGPLSSVYWAIPASGTQLSEDAASALEAIWQQHLHGLTGAKTSAKRNPPWQRDELILALELYVRHNGAYLSESHGDVIELSSVLNSLPIHEGKATDDKFRNPNGVSMKLLNFRRFDKTQSGVGLSRGNRLEQVVWDEFAGRPEVLRLIADGIRSGFQAVEPTEPEPDEETFPEGKVLFRLHRQRERKPKVITKAKALELKKTGKLCCCVCQFDFAAKYGKIGEGFIEGHHTRPLWKLTEETETTVAEIALVCSNCHRMLHRRTQELGVDELRSLLNS